VRLERLEVSDYRNIHRLDISLPGGLGVFVGNNAEGKSNLLEAVYLLATMRGVRAETDAQLIRREALDDVLPAARVVGHAASREGPVKVEVTVVARPGASGPVATKTVKVNGVAKRLSDAVGRLTAVLFTAEDLDMIVGAPSLRRRYIDMTLMQADSRYAAARSRFERVLTQRNHLLRRIRETAASPDELPFWDSELAQYGGLLFQRRASTLARIGEMAKTAHAALAPGEHLAVAYRPRLEPLTVPLAGATEDEAAEAYAGALRAGAARDIAAGMTLQGPHRDDIHFSLNGMGAAGFASRAQQRTIALSLRLAEVRFLHDCRGEAPLLLLDDVLSEMDAGRRDSVMAGMSDVEQMLVTGTDWDRFPEAFLAEASRFQVAAGSVQPLVPGQAAPGTTDS
jgi:DNA replication and repair protein RecF